MAEARRTTANLTEAIEDNAKNALLELDSDPKLQEVLEMYQKLPAKAQDTMLLMIDAFTAGMEAQKAISALETA